LHCIFAVWNSEVCVVKTNKYKNIKSKAMSTQKNAVVTIESTIDAPVQKVWDYWTSPAHIVKWNSPSEDWHSPRATNDLRPGGKFSARMEARDGSMGFDFEGVYDAITINEYIEYTLTDGRKVKVNFKSQGDKTHVSESFDPENEHPLEMQRAGWQAILDNFKKYVEQA
jgi:uncharacterized protein YndB with AHSA1/START domain